MANCATWFQHAATVASFVGGAAETSGAIAGALVGTPVGILAGFVDGPLPLVEFGVGLAGLVEGASEGHLFHLAITNPVESVCSSISTASTVASDIFLGNTRLDIYEDRAEIVIGQPTSTSLVLTALGNKNNTAVIDFPIDLYGSLYAEEKVPGIYDILGITGKTIPLYHPSLYLKFGDVDEPK